MVLMKMASAGTNYVSFRAREVGGEWFWKDGRTIRPQAGGAPPLQRFRNAISYLHKPGDRGVWGSRLNDEELIALDMLEDGEYALIGTIPGLYVVED